MCTEADAGQDLTSIIHPQLRLEYMTALSNGWLNPCSHVKVTGPARPVVLVLSNTYAYKSNQSHATSTELSSQVGMLLQLAKTRRVIPQLTLCDSSSIHPPFLNLDVAAKPVSSAPQPAHTAGRSSHDKCSATFSVCRETIKFFYLTPY